MRNWIQRMLAVMVVSAVLAANACGQTAPKKAGISTADAALAERFSELARRALQTPNITDATWKQAAALLEASCKLNPAELRYPRMLAEACIQSKDWDGAIRAYNMIVKEPKLDPFDQGAQIAIVDLYRFKMQSVDQQMKYLKQVMERPSVMDEVRSFAATKLARAMMERGQKKEALAMLLQALKFNPLNPEALAARYQLIESTATPLEKVQAVLAGLRSNPAQPGVAWLLARQLADAGLVKESNDWYTTAGSMMPKMGTAVPLELVAQFVCELYIADQTAPASLVAGHLTDAEPNSMEGWFVRLMLDKDSGNTPDTRIQQQATLVVSNRLAEVRKAAGIAGATTKPTDDPDAPPVPDLTEDITKVKADSTGALAAKYAAPAAQWAWLELFFKSQPAEAAKLLKFVKSILPENAPEIARLEGWSLLLDKKPDEAKSRLTSAADGDPMAKMGLLVAQMKDGKLPDDAAAEARKLVSAHPNGLIGAILWHSLKGPNVKIVPDKTGDAIAAELKKFPKGWMDILDTASNFYAVRLDPVQIQHNFDEPMLVRVTIQNTSDFDLCMGSDGILHPDMWIDAEQRGINPQSFPGVAYDRITQRTVLRSRHAVSQVVRLDQGPLSQFLMKNPSVTVPLSATLMTNPMTLPTGIGPGPGGYKVQMPRIMQRQGFAMTANSKQRLLSKLAQADGADKMRGIEMMAVYSLKFNDPKAGPDPQALAADLVYSIESFANSDKTPQVQAWAQYLLTAGGSDAQKLDQMTKMAADPYWVKHLLALMSAQAMPPDQEKEFSSKLTGEKEDAAVRDYAKARLEALRIAATRPAAAAAPAALQPLPASGPGPASAPLAAPLNTTAPASTQP